MSQVPAALNSEQEDAYEMMADLGHVGVRLAPHELIKFNRSFERQFLVQGVFRDMSDLAVKHRPEILMAAMIAKAQMKAEIDGESPAAGKIGGPLAMQAAYLGVGDSWEDINGIYANAQSSWSTGSAQSWIHSGTTLLAGTGGNAVKILENAVHIIIAYGSLHAEPKIESVQFTIDGKTKPYLNVFRPLRLGNGNYQMRLRELDNVIILKNKSTLLAKVFISQAFGARSAYQQDFPYLFGFSFLSEDVLRLQDPSSLPGTTVNIITTT